MTFARTFSKLLDEKNIPAIEKFLQQNQLPILDLGFTKEDVRILEQKLQEKNYPFAASEYQFLKQTQREKLTDAIRSFLKKLKINSIKLILSIIEDPILRSNIEKKMIQYEKSTAIHDTEIDNYITDSISQPPLLDIRFAPPMSIIGQINQMLSYIETFRNQGSNINCFEIDIKYMLKFDQTGLYTNLYAVDSSSYAIYNKIKKQLKHNPSLPVSIPTNYTKNKISPSIPYSFFKASSSPPKTNPIAIQALSRAIPEALTCKN